MRYCSSRVVTVNSPQMMSNTSYSLAPTCPPSSRPNTSSLDYHTHLPFPANFIYSIFLFTKALQPKYVQNSFGILPSRSYSVTSKVLNAYLCFLADHFRLPDVLQSIECSPYLDFVLCISIFCHFCSQVCELCYLFYMSCSLRGIGVNINERKSGTDRTKKREKR